MIFNHSYESNGITYCYRPTHLINGTEVSMVPNSDDKTVCIINTTAELTKINLETQKKQNNTKKEATRKKKATEKEQVEEMEVEVDDSGTVDPSMDSDASALKKEVSKPTLNSMTTEMCVVCNRSTVRLINLWKHKCCGSCKTAYYRAVVKLHEHIIDITETQTTLPDLATET